MRNYVVLFSLFSLHAFVIRKILAMRKFAYYLVHAFSAGIIYDCFKKCIANR